MLYTWKPSKILESLQREVLEDLAQSPVTEGTTRGLVEKAKNACVGELWGSLLEKWKLTWKSGSGIGRNGRSILNTVFFRLLDALFPQIWEENGGVSYSPNVAYIYIGEILRYLCY